MRRLGNRDDGALGREFQRELVASARHLWGDVLGDRCNIPDEKRGSRSGYWGEKRIADLVIPAPRGVTLYIEAKATGSDRWEWRKLTQNQREAMQLLADHGHDAWLLLLFRPREPIDGRFVNAVFAWHAVAAVANVAAVERGGYASVSYGTLSAIRRNPTGDVTCLMEVPSMPVQGGRGWDLSVLIEKEDDR